MNPTQRALADRRTLYAARSGVRPLRCADGGAEKRSDVTGADVGTGAGRRSSSASLRPGWSVIGLLGGRAWSGGVRVGSRLDAAGGRQRRLDARLADRDGQRAEGE